MSDYNDLYQQLILDHGRDPRNFGPVENPTHTKEGYNPLCGDKITIYLDKTGDIITDLKFTGSGCAISMASASLMTQVLKGKSVKACDKLFNDVIELLTDGLNPEATKALGKLSVLSGVVEFPARVKCASLCWHTFRAALNNSSDMISTE
mgnify:CR=1 FL=1